MEEKPTKDSIDFKITTLRRRLKFVIDKTERHGDAQMFNKWEISALQSAITALENETRYDEVSTTFVSLLTAIETGNADELLQIVEVSKDVIDKYEL